MNDEIKEILDNFEKYEARYKLHNETQFIITHREIETLLDYITNLQEENEFLKLNNPEMNIEHFRIVKENKRKIDNLRKENEKLKTTLKGTTHCFDEEEHKKLQQENERLKDKLSNVAYIGLKYALRIDKANEELQKLINDINNKTIIGLNNFLPKLKKIQDELENGGDDK